MDPNHYPIDYTGAGPTGYGNAPTFREQRQQASNRFYTERGNMTMQYLDPLVRRAVEGAMRVVAADNSPEAARRAAFQQPGGQMARDAAMMARMSGLLGHGDPMQYSSSITRGVAAGGFNMTFGGEMGGQSLYGRSDRVTGQGAISEKVSQHYRRGVMEQLYGKNDVNPGSFFGFDVAEAGMLFEDMTRRGGLGEVAHVERNARVSTRLAAAKADAMNVGDTDLLRGLEAVQIEAGDHENELAQLQAYADAAIDPKLQKTLNDMGKQEATVLIRPDAAKKAAEKLQRMGESLSSLADLYGELGAPALRQKMEQLTGMQIHDTKSMSKAQAMVNSMRGSAEQLGMDPRAFMEMSQMMQAGVHGRLSQAFGFDDRSEVLAKEVTGAISNRALRDATDLYSNSDYVSRRMGELGIEGGSRISLEEAYNDQILMQETTARQDKGMITLAGMELTGGFAETQAALIKEYNNAIGDEERRAVELKARTQLEEISETSGNRVSWDAFADSNVAINARARTIESGVFTDVIAKRSRESQNIGGLTSVIQGMQEEGKLDLGDMSVKGAGESLAFKLGTKGMLDIHRVATDDRLDENGNPALDTETRLKTIDDMLAAANFSEEEAAQVRGLLLDSEGKLKDEEVFNKLTSQVSSSTRGDTSDYAQSAYSANRLRNFKSSEARIKLSNNGVLDWASVSAALAQDTGALSRDPDALMHVSQMLADEGIKLPDMYATDENGNARLIDADKETARNIDFSQGLTEEGLSAIGGVIGDDFSSMAKDRGFESVADMVAASNAPGKAGSDLTLSVLEELRGSGYRDKGLIVSGESDALNAISSDLLGAKLDQDGPFQAQLRRLQGAQHLLRGEGYWGERQLGGDFNTALEQSIKDGGPADFSAFEADDFGGKKPKIRNTKNAQGDKQKVVDMGAGTANLLDLVHTLTTGDAATVASVVELDTEGHLLGELETLMGTFTEVRKNAKGEEVTALVDGKSGEKEGFDLHNENMQAVAEAIRLLSGNLEQSKGDQTAHFEHVTIASADITTINPPP
jgi:hypothetical protein